MAHVTVADGSDRGRWGQSRDRELLSSLLNAIARGRAVTRAELAQTHGLARSTVGQYVNLLLSSRVVIERGAGQPDGGRPPMVLQINPRAGVLLAADIGATHSRLSVCDLNAASLAELSFDIDVNDGPATVLGLVSRGFTELLAGAGRGARDVLGIGVGLPGPVEHSTGTVVRPPIMAGWDGYHVPSFFREAGSFPNTPILVDNDVNVMALGEHWVRDYDVDYLLFIKIGTGIGCGIITHGEVHRGADGAAGDIGHIRLPEHETTVCPCGNVGCVEAVSSGAALARRLREQGIAANSASDVARLALEGNAQARREIRIAGEHLGEVVAALVSFYNPACIVVGGALAQLSEDLIAGIRGVVYQRALPLATRRLVIEISKSGDHAGVIGAAILALRSALGPAGVGHLLRSSRSQDARPAPRRAGGGARATRAPG